MSVSDIQIISLPRREYDRLRDIESRCDALVADNERLRAALETLAQRHHSHDNGACLRNPTLDLTPCQVAEIARTALASPTPSDSAPGTDWRKLAEKHTDAWDAFVEGGEDADPDELENTQVAIFDAVRREREKEGKSNA